VQHRGPDGTPGATRGWTRIGFVEGGGTTDRPQSYRFRTEDLAPGTHRFRLRQVNTDGSGALSRAVTVEVGLQAVYRLTPPAPNPSTGAAQLQLTLRKTQPVRAAVYDVLGREVAVLHEGTLAGQTPTTLRTGRTLPAGTYFVRVRGTHFTATERLTVVR
jgi:hypothetical protein